MHTTARLPERKPDSADRCEACYVISVVVLMGEGRGAKMKCREFERTQNSLQTTNISREARGARSHIYALTKGSPGFARSSSSSGISSTDGMGYMGCGAPRGTTMVVVERQRRGDFRLRVHDRWISDFHTSSGAASY